MDTVTICNLALAHIGDQSILSLDDPSQEARFCNLLYDPTRREILRSHNWNFAVSLVQLPMLTDSPPFDWAYAYQLPIDFFKLIQVNAFGSEQTTQNYEIQGRQLLSDKEEAAISYVRDITDANYFDSVFTEILALRLAARLAKPLAGSMDISTRLNADYKYLLGEARRIDGVENQLRKKPLWVNSSLVQSRIV
jgi:hypothetical protein